MAAIKIEDDDGQLHSARKSESGCLCFKSVDVRAKMNGLVDSSGRGDWIVRIIRATWQRIGSERQMVGREWKRKVEVMVNRPAAVLFVCSTAQQYCYNITLALFLFQINTFCLLTFGGNTISPARQRPCVSLYVVFQIDD